MGQRILRTVGLAGLGLMTGLSFAAGYKPAVAMGLDLWVGRVSVLAGVGLALGSAVLMVGGQAARLGPLLLAGLLGGLWAAFEVEQGWWRWASVVLNGIAVVVWGVGAVRVAVMAEKAVCVAMAALCAMGGWVSVRAMLALSGPLDPWGPAPSLGRGDPAVAIGAGGIVAGLVFLLVCVLGTILLSLADE